MVGVANLWESTHLVVHVTPLGGEILRVGKDSKEASIRASCLDHPGDGRQAKRLQVVDEFSGNGHEDFVGSGVGFEPQIRSASLEALVRNSLCDIFAEVDTALEREVGV